MGGNTFDVDVESMSETSLDFPLLVNDNSSLLASMSSLEIWTSRVPSRKGRNFRFDHRPLGGVVCSAMVESNRASLIFYMYFDVTFRVSGFVLISHFFSLNGK